MALFKRLFAALDRFTDEIISNSARARELALLWTFVICPIFVFANHLTTYRITGWDTFDYQFPKFLYLADCLWNFEFPLWNPFTGAGDLFHSQAIYPANPLMLPFLFLAGVINPILAFEFSNLGVLLLGLLGLRKLLRRLNTQAESIQIIAASVFSMLLAGPLMGQIVFVGSFVALVWIYYFLIRIFEDDSTLVVSFAAGCGCALIASLGYIYLNLCSAIVLSLVFANDLLWKRRRLGAKTAFHLALFLLPFFAVSFAIVYPTVENTRYFYRWFSGDLVSTDPRIRFFPPKPTDSTYSTPSWLHILLSTFDTELKRPGFDGWHRGVGIGLFTFLLAAIAQRLVPLKSTLKAGLSWLVSAVVFAVLSFGFSLTINREFVSKIPLFNNNRFPIVLLNYVEICWFFIGIWILNTAERPKAPLAPRYRLAISIAIAAGGLLIFSAPLWLAVGVLFFFVTDSRAWASETLYKKQIFQVLLAGTILSRLVYDPGILKMIDVRPTGWNISGRTTDPEFKGNLRDKPALDKAGKPPTDLEYTDMRWVTEKRPYTHGYTLFNHPLYAKIKNLTLVETIFSITDQVRVEPAPVREHYSSDNALIDALATDIEKAEAEGRTLVHDPLALDAGPALQAKLSGFSIRPNSAAVDVVTNKAALVVNTSKFLPGWSALIDGKPAPIVLTNYIFSGVLVPEGHHRIEFRFQPDWRWVLVIPYLAMLMAIGAAGIMRWRRYYPESL